LRLLLGWVHSYPTPRSDAADESLDQFGTRFSGTLGIPYPGIIGRFRTMAGVADSAIPSSELIELLQTANAASRRSAGVPSRAVV
jgi:hypothetical protein